MGILADWQVARDVKIDDAQEGKKRDGKISYGYTSYGYDARCGYKWKVFSPIMCSEIDPKKFDDNALVEVDLSPKTCDLVAHGGNMRVRSIYRCKTCLTEYPTEGPHHCFIQPPNYILIPPHSFVLGETVETFTIPRDCLCIVLGKSTYARCGLVVNVTPGEPEWTGKWTVEISNTTPLPARVYCNEGVMQCIFLRTDGHAEALLNAVRKLCGQEVQSNCSILGRPSEVNTFARIEQQLHAELGNGACKTSYADKKGKYQNQTGLTSPKVDGDKNG